MNELYFQALNSSLKQAGIHYPSLIIDKQRLDQNIDHLLQIINQGYHYRIVAKSLPSIPLIRYIMRRTGSNRLMSFHLPFLIGLIQQIPEADILLGKPMPISAVQAFYHWKQNTLSSFDDRQQLQWLVDSFERLQEYQDFAQRHGLRLQINLEINVGLNRGGFSDPEAFKQALLLLQNSDHLTFSGLMGYEAHITKMPAFLGGSEKAFRHAMYCYQQRLDQVKAVFGEARLQHLCLNGAGSSTYPLYDKQTKYDKNTSPVINEIASASALVKPTDFDAFTLTHHTPACFIAAPVLKDVSAPEIPLAPRLTRALQFFGKAPKQGVFIYGGNWLAQPCYPPGCYQSSLFGHSSNQEFYEVPANSLIQRDDFLFFRPHQSEAVFLQFGDLLLLDDGQIKHRWPVFQYPTDYLPEAASLPETSAQLISNIKPSQKVQ
ncbi:alanine racemase [Bacterioplanoides sp.]|uniref:alanine racemase n=1 Tax=Bacterioplanoides sp. TaxID=2066072 RepID=UPI003B00D67E